MAHQRSDAGSSLVWMMGGVCMAVLWCGVGARAEYGELGPAIPRAADTVLKVARSENGRSFTESGKVFVSRAAAPALATLRDGTIVALFDYAGESDANTSTVLAVSVSKSGGASWSPARSLRLAGRRARDITARHATLVRASDRYLRLYFVAEVTDGTRAAAYRRFYPRFRSAVSTIGWIRRRALGPAALSILIRSRRCWMVRCISTFPVPRRAGRRPPRGSSTSSPGRGGDLRG